MSSFEFGKRSRKRRSSRSRRVSKGRSRSRRSRSRHSRRGSYKRVGNKINVVVRGKTKSLKVKKNKEGREYYVSGKRRTKHFLEGSVKRSKRSSRSRRKFGGLIDIMGNFSPAEMSLAQSTTGLSAPQMIRHIGEIPPSLRSNFYTNLI
jgi:hypothetical protein